MTTVNYSVDQDAAAGYVSVEWAGLNSGDDGQPFHCAGLKIASIHYHSTFSGGPVEVLATNEISPSAYVTVDSANSPRINLPTVSSAASLLSVGYIKPDFPSGSGNAAVSILFLAK